MTDEAKVISLSFEPEWFPDRQELASSLVSRFKADDSHRPQVIIRGHDFNATEWEYRIIATRFIDLSGGLNRVGSFEIEGIVVGGYDGKWHLGHRLLARYNHANNDDPTKGEGINWHFDNELAIYVPIYAHNQVDCPGHPDQAPLGTGEFAHELCTYCGAKEKVSLEKALTHKHYSNLRQERHCSV